MCGGYEMSAKNQGLEISQSMCTADPVEHQVTLRQIRQWVDTNAKSPREMIQKNRLKELLPH